jgi:peroxiredoxin
VKPSTLLLTLCLGLFTTAAWAALKPGDAAPDFTVDAALGGKEFKFSLAEALKKGPVVLYFYPKSFTSVCTVEAHEFAENIENFAAAGASVIGLSGDKIEVQRDFSTKECRDKFPVGADPSFSVIKAYDAAFNIPVVGAVFANRISYVISPEGKILYAYSDSNAEKHIENTLAVVRKWREQQQALIVRVSLGHILLTPAKSQEHTSDFFGPPSSPFCSSQRTSPRSRRRRPSAMTLWPTDATRRRCTIRSVARSTISDGTLVFLLTWGRTHLSLNKSAPALRAV